MRSSIYDANGNKVKYPGWRTMTAAQRYNAKMDAIWEQARRLGAFDPPPVEPKATEVAA